MTFVPADYEAFLRKRSAQAKNIQLFGKAALRAIDWMRKQGMPDRAESLRQRLISVHQGWLDKVKDTTGRFGAALQTGEDSLKLYDDFNQYYIENVAPFDEMMIELSKEIYPNNPTRLFHPWEALVPNLTVGHVLGLGMVGGGLWYFRRKAKAHR